MAYKFVKVPYRAQFGPTVKNNMYTSSLKNFHADYHYNTSKNTPPPTAFGCIGSWANTGKGSKPRYRYFDEYIYVSDTVIKAAKNKYKYVITRALSPDGPEGKSMGMLRCIVPHSYNSEKIIEGLYKAMAKERSPNIHNIHFITKTYPMNSAK